VEEHSIDLNADKQNVNILNVTD